jgi:hypothetical protein
MQRFYEQVIGLPLMTRFPNSAFFKIAEGYSGHTQVLALFDRSDGLGYRRANAETSTFDHIAFEIPLADFEGEKKRLEGLGLDRWRDPGGNMVETCSILTTTPNAATSAVHDRMPVILDPDGYDLWLDPGMRDVSAASELLKPYDARLMRCHPISTRINHVANDDEECSRPVEIADAQNRLLS